MKIYDKQHCAISQWLNATQEMLTYSIASQHFNVVSGGFPAESLSYFITAVDLHHHLFA